MKDFKAWNKRSSTPSTAWALVGDKNSDNSRERQREAAHLVRHRRLGHLGAFAAPLRRGGGVADLAIAAQAVGADLVAVELLRGLLDLALGAHLHACVKQDIAGNEEAHSRRRVQLFWALMWYLVPDKCPAWLGKAENEQQANCCGQQRQCPSEQGHRQQDDAGRVQLATITTGAGLRRWRKPARSRAG